MSTYCLLQNSLAFITTKPNQNLLFLCPHLPLLQLLVSGEEGLVRNGPHGSLLQLYLSPRIFQFLTPGTQKQGPWRCVKSRVAAWDIIDLKLCPKFNGWSSLYGQVGGGDLRCRKTVVWPWHIWRRRRNWNSTATRQRKSEKVPELWENCPFRASRGKRSCWELRSSVMGREE